LLEFSSTIYKLLTKSLWGTDGLTHGPHLRVLCVLQPISAVTKALSYPDLAVLEHCEASYTLGLGLWYPSAKREAEAL